MPKLNDKKVRTAPPGRYYDGGGLILRVRESGSRDWALRITKDGKTTDYGLGGFPLVSLAEAREAAFDLRRAIKRGDIPQRKAKAGGDLFETLAEDYIKAHAPGWKNPKSADQWRSSLKAYAYPTIGKKAAQSITTADVLDILRPIWQDKTETASRVRGRIEKVLDYATAHGMRLGDNPARWVGHLSTLMPKRTAVAKVEHHAAMHYRDLPEFWKKLAKLEGSGAAALRWPTGYRRIAGCAVWQRSLNSGQKRPRHKGRGKSREGCASRSDRTGFDQTGPATSSNRCQSAFQQRTHAGLAVAFIDLLDGGVRSRIASGQSGKVVAFVGGGRCLAGEMRPSTIQRLGIRRASVFGQGVEGHATTAADFTQLIFNPADACQCPGIGSARGARASLAVGFVVFRSHFISP